MKLFTLKRFFVVTLLMCLLSITYAQSTFTNPILPVDAADPTVLLAEDGYYYMCCSEHYANEGMPLWRSADMINWEKVTNIFAQRPENVSYTFLWAPELVKIGNKYVLYYSNADYGSQQNTQICVATSDKPYGPYTNNKILIRAKDSNFGALNANVNNVIDPSYFKDDNGTQYLIWGSFNGIFSIKLNAEGTGIASGASKKTLLTKNNASGDAEDNAEAACIYKRNGYYYLLTSVGSTANLTGTVSTPYHINVARSSNNTTASLDNVTFVDKDGNNVNSQGGLFTGFKYYHCEGLLASNDYVYAPGHCSNIIKDKNNNEWIFFHGYAKKNGSWDWNTGRVLYACNVVWDNKPNGWLPNGWPGIMPPSADPIDMPVIPDEAKDKQKNPEIETVNFANGFLPAKQFNNGYIWSADTWVALSDAAYGGGEASNPNFNKIQGTPDDIDGKKWYATDYQPGNDWENHFATFSDQGSYKWAPDGKCGDLYFRRYFKVEGDIPSEIYMAAGHDDSPSEYYLNGQLIWSEPGTKSRNGWDPNEVVKLTDDQKTYIKTDGSVNVLAVHVHQNWGGYLADVGLYKDGTPKTNYDASRTPVDEKLTAILEDEVYGPYLVNAKVVKEAQESQSIRDNNDALAALNAIKCATLDEEATNVTSDAKYDAALVKRSFTGGRWNTFCVPFDMTIDDLTSALGGASNGVEIKELVDADDTDGDGSYTLKFGTANEINAGKCYLVWITQTVPSKDFVVGSADVNVTKGPEASEEFDVLFQGTYNKCLAPYGSYIINNNMFYCVDSDVNVKAFRGWFVIPGEIAGSALSITFDDSDVTGISLVDENASTELSTGWYNIAGQRVNENAKGIIIKNGKKFFVK